MGTTMMMRLGWVWMCGGIVSTAAGQAEVGIGTLTVEFATGVQVDLTEAIPAGRYNSYSVDFRFEGTGVTPGWSSEAAWTLGDVPDNPFVGVFNSEGAFVDAAIAADSDFTPDPVVLSWSGRMKRLIVSGGEGGGVDEDVWFNAGASIPETSARWTRVSLTLGAEFPFITDFAEGEINGEGQVSGDTRGRPDTVNGQFGTVPNASPPFFPQNTYRLGDAVYTLNWAGGEALFRLTVPAPEPTVFGTPGAWVHDLRGVVVASSASVADAASPAGLAVRTFSGNLPAGQYTVIIDGTTGSSPGAPIPFQGSEFTLDIEAVCAADLNGDGVLEAADVVDALGGIAAGTNGAYDFNSDGTVDFRDVTFQLGRFDAGCP